MASFLICYTKFVPPFFMLLKKLQFNTLYFFANNYLQTRTFRLYSVKRVLMTEPLVSENNR